MAGALLWPLTAAGAAITYSIYKRAQKASASVPDRYTKVSSVFPEEYDDVERPTDIYLLFVSLENMDLLGNFKRDSLTLRHGFKKLSFYGKWCLLNFPAIFLRYVKCQHFLDFFILQNSTAIVNFFI